MLTTIFNAEVLNALSFYSPLRVMHSILSCRLVIHIREVADDESRGAVEGLEEPVFRSNVEARSYDLEALRIEAD